MGALKPDDGRTKVLIVDDSGIIRTLVRQIIAVDEVFNVVGEAADGFAATLAVVKLKPDLVVLDIEMPKMSGIEVLERLKLLSQAKVIVLSSVAQAASEIAATAKRLGAFDVIPKPSGSVSLDLKPKRGRQLLEVMHAAVGLPPPDFNALALRAKERGPIESS
ncbi:MAG: response regulator [Proteobacteria bacterium]|nr:response regulator [Pseudomonadota bacterium]MBI3499835.1 response regulator [Pseudomonadota bacterium]